MTGGSLLLLMLLISWTSLVLQGAAAVHLWRQRNSPGRLAGRGYLRTAGCRALAACIYVTVALLQVTGVQVPGAGGLSPEALVVFCIVQFIWIANSAMDVAVRRKLAGEGRGRPQKGLGLWAWCGMETHLDPGHRSIAAAGGWPGCGDSSVRRG